MPQFRSRKGGQAYPIHQGVAPRGRPTRTLHTRKTHKRYPSIDADPPKRTGIPPGKMLLSEPFKYDGSTYIIQNSGEGMNDHFVVYGYSMGGPGGIPIAVRRESDGEWVNYMNKAHPVPQAEQTKYNEIAEKTSAKNYHYDAPKAADPPTTLYGSPHRAPEISTSPIVLGVRSGAITYDSQTGIATYLRSHDPDKIVRFRPTPSQRQRILEGSGGVNIHQNQVISSSVPGVSA